MGYYDKEALLKLVAEYYSLTPEEIKSPRRDMEVAKARHVAVYLLRKEFSLSYPAIGLFLGGRDHTTAMHSYRKINYFPDLRTMEEIAWIKNKFLENKNDSTRNNTGLAQ